MSGGSYDYAYSKLEDFIGSLRCTTPERAAFRQHLIKIAKAMHDIEWSDSGDIARDGGDTAAILECIPYESVVLEAEKKVEEAIKTYEDVVAHYRALKSTI